MNRQLSITIVLFSFFTLLFSNALCQPNTNIRASGSSVEKYDEGTAYGDEIDQGLEMLTYGVAETLNLRMDLAGRLAVGFAYCEPHLRERLPDCTTCLQAANAFLREDYGCAYAVSAYVMMVDCGIRYDPRPPSTGK